MIIYSEISGPRLRFIGDHVSFLLFGQPAFYTSDKNEFTSGQGVKINYSPARIHDDEYHIQSSGILNEKGIRDTMKEVAEVRDRKVLMPNAGDPGFDLFGAAFYLLSRYEEYLPHQKDVYGRFDHRNSIAFRENFLLEPLVDQWISDLAIALQKKFPQGFPVKWEGAFKFLPTYDIDEAWSFREKSGFISLGGATRDLLKGKFSRISQRRRVRAGTEQDPFDSYDHIDKLHAKHGLEPVYFFLVAEKRSRYDRNINPHRPAFRELVKRHAGKYRIGLHPSWQSSRQETLESEKRLLEGMTGEIINDSRQHFIHFTLPEGYRALIAAGITADYSMGYGTINGFRASTSHPFFWYDLLREEQSKLRVFPFCYMDANCFFEQHLSPLQAEQEMRLYYDKVKAVGGTFIPIWHNTFLGTDPLFSGWKEAYRNFLTGIRS